MNISSLASIIPTARGSAYSAPMSGNRPTLANDMQNDARSDASTKSAASASENPAPAAGPSTAAITGISRSRSRRSHLWMSCRRRRMASGARADGSGLEKMPWIDFRSPPAQKLPADPVRISARMLRSLSTQSSMSW
ncbi:hypothetical protein D3C81_983690 [compost metagenome]